MTFVTSNYYKLDFKNIIKFLSFIYFIYMCVCVCVCVFDEKCLIININKKMYFVCVN